MTSETKRLILAAYSREGPPALEPGDGTPHEGHLVNQVTNPSDKFRVFVCSTCSTCFTDSSLNPNYR